MVWLDVDADLSTSVVATLAAGGEHLSMGGGGDDLALQPLVEIDTAEGLAWAQAWLMDLLDAHGSAGAAAALAQALALLAAGPERERTLTHLRPLVQSEGLRTALEPWCRGGPQGDLLDADRDRLRDSPWTTVDLGRLLERGRNSGIKSQCPNKCEFCYIKRSKQSGEPSISLPNRSSCQTQSDSKANP